jgi:hypothetical protein
MTWTFSDPPNVAVFTTWPIVRGEDWIGLVYRDADDGAWQFLGASGVQESDKPAIVGLRQILGLDASIAELADLPIGWRAWRAARDAPWHRSKTG